MDININEIRTTTEKAINGSEEKWRLHIEDFFTKQIRKAAAYGQYKLFEPSFCLSALAYPEPQRREIEARKPILREVLAELTSKGFKVTTSPAESGNPGFIDIEISWEN